MLLAGLSGLGEDVPARFSRENSSAAGEQSRASGELSTSSGLSKPSQQPKLLWPAASQHTPLLSYFCRHSSRCFQARNPLQPCLKKPTRGKQ